jgi:hypothetical protein
MRKSVVFNHITLGGPEYAIMFLVEKQRAKLLAHRENGEE